MFFSFDGIDGVGKSTQVRLFCAWLRETGRRVTECRDPGSTPLGERVRDLLLHAGDATPIGGRAEMLLYMAARAQLVEQVIRPALAAGEVVVSDRYLLANVVYQGHAGGLDPDDLWRVGQVATAGLMPDLVFLLDMDPVVADRRIERARDRVELRGEGYRQRLREGFLAEARKAPDRVVVVDAGDAVDRVAEQIREAARALLGGAPPSGQSAD